MDALDNARQQLRQLWLTRFEALLAGLQLDASAKADTASPELRQLQQLCQFLALPPPAAPKGPAGCQLAETAASTPQAIVALLQDLLQVQSSLSGQNPASGRLQLREILGRELLQLAGACRKSEWNLSWFVGSGLAQRCHSATLLSHFCHDAELTTQLRRIQWQVAVWHAAGSNPDSAGLTGLQQALLALARPGAARPPLPADADRAEPAVPDALTLDELTTWQRQFENELQMFSPPTERLLLASYRLVWVLQVAGWQQAADCGQLVYQLLARHWQLLEPVSRALHALLRHWLALLPGSGPERPAELPQLLSLLAAALRAWPERRSEELPATAWPGQHQGAGHALHTRQIPELMASSLRALLDVAPAWLSRRSAWECSCPLLLPELHLLERGAAALRLGTLELFASQLLSLHQLLALARTLTPWPAATLWHLHAELVALLDRTALWQEVRASDASQQAMQQLLEQAETHLQQPPPSTDPGAGLAATLALYLRQLGRLLGKELRLQLVSDTLTARTLPAPAALQQLLRWLLLQEEHSVDWRRERRLPAASSLTLALQAAQYSGEAAAENQAEIDVEVLEPDSTTLPSPRALRSLQRTLGSAAVTAPQADLLPGAGRRLRLRMRVG